MTQLLSDYVRRRFAADTFYPHLCPVIDCAVCMYFERMREQAQVNCLDNGRGDRIRERPACACNTR